jgi:hypothetical protein
MTEYRKEVVHGNNVDIPNGVLCLNAIDTLANVPNILVLGKQITLCHAYLQINLPPGILQQPRINKIEYAAAGNRVIMTNKTDAILNESMTGQELYMVMPPFNMNIEDRLYLRLPLSPIYNIYFASTIGLPPIQCHLMYDILITERGLSETELQAL